MSGLFIDTGLVCFDELVCDLLVEFTLGVVVCCLFLLGFDLVLLLS